MRIETARFGPVEVQEEALIQFPWGIPGFENLKRYVLWEHGKGPFQWLQAVDDPAVAFVVCPPQAMGFAYQVPQAKLKMLNVVQIEDLVVLIMVSFDREKNTSRPHLSGPLLFNAANRRACQWTIDANELPQFLVSEQ